MSDREAFEKWAQDKDFVIGTPVGRIGLKDAAWEVWQAAQAQAVNQQLLGDIINMMIAAKGAIKLGRDLDATNYISAAIAAAQEQGE